MSHQDECHRCLNLVDRCECARGRRYVLRANLGCVLLVVAIIVTLIAC